MVYDLSVPSARDPVIGITVVAVITILTATLRILGRRIRKNPLGTDDYFMLAALLFMLVGLSLHYACIFAGGLGRHSKLINPQDGKKILQLVLPFEMIYAIELCLIKISIIHFYFRIFGTVKSFRIASYMVMAIIVAWAIAVNLETLLICRPFTFNWDFSVPGGTCGNRRKVYLSAGVINIITDFMVIALPIPLVFKLQLPLRRKLGLVAMFSMGTFITIVSILRMVSLLSIHEGITDIYFSLSDAFVWTTIEPCLCIINANLPMTRTYLATVAPSIFGTSIDREAGMITASERSAVRHSQFQPIEDEPYGWLDVEDQNDAKSKTLRTESRVSSSAAYEMRDVKQTMGTESSVSAVVHELDGLGSGEMDLRNNSKGIFVGKSVHVNYV